MNGGDTEGEVFVALARDVEAGLSDHVGEGLLVGELSDALHQVLVGVSVVGDELAHHRQEGKGVDLVEVVQCWLLDLRELQAGKDSTRLQDAVGGVQAGLDVSEVSDSERNCVHVLRAVWNGVHSLTVLFKKLYSRRVGVRRREAALLPLSEHVRVDVCDGHRRLVVAILESCVVQQPKCNVARAPSNV